LSVVTGRAADSSRTFPETGQTVSGPFLAYWDAHGGLSQQGYPISAEMQEKSPLNGKVYTVQYFERAVLEKHPENRAPYDVLLSQLGNFRYRQKYPTGAPGQHASTAAGTRLFAETGKHVGGKFLAYWTAHGGVAQQGYPISEEFQEKSDLDGKTYTVQYFERAVFEAHPEKAAPYDVLLSQLGTYRYQAQYPVAAKPVLPAPISANLPSSVALSNGGPAPEFTGITEWINSAPLTLQSLRGKVVLVHFWTFACINCIHVQPYVKSWYARYKDAGFTVVGVHTPELSFEKDIGNVRAAVRDKGVLFPVAFDPKYATWSAFNNSYWPAFYYVDKHGQIRYTHAGEGDYDGQEQAIRQLLLER
ncbi:MAG TPA: redoxin family protein, partial [Chloroflexia bacterium]|nr:redoxin family protein [Chloroflexia bacterium]